MPAHTTVISLFAIAQGEMYIAVGVMAWMVMIGRVRVIFVVTTSTMSVMTTPAVMVVAAIC